MPSYASLKATVTTLLRGASNSASPALLRVSATIDRLEGARRYLVAVLHGAGASADQVLGLVFLPSPLSLWLGIAAREQLVVIAPDAGKCAWSDCFASNARVVVTTWAFKNTK